MIILKMKNYFNLLILVIGLFLILAACSAQTETEGSKSDQAPATEDGSTEDSEKDSISDPPTDAETDGSNAQTKPLAEMTVDDLTEYLVKLNLIKENSETSKICCVGSDSIRYIDEKVDVYWYDLENMDDALKQEYEGAKKDGYVTIQPSGAQVMLEVHGPFGITNNKPKAEEILKAVKDLK